jgi:hypothetical protein
MAGAVLRRFKCGHNGQLKRVASMPWRETYEHVRKIIRARPHTYNLPSLPLYVYLHALAPYAYVRIYKSELVSG